MKVLYSCALRTGKQSICLDEVYCTIRCEGCKKHFTAYVSAGEELESTLEGWICLQCLGNNTEQFLELAKARFGI